MILCVGMQCLDLFIFVLWITKIKIEKHPNSLKMQLLLLF